VVLLTAPAGGVQDNQLVIQFLEDYIFPLGKRRIDEFMISGVSLGGEQPLLTGENECFTNPLGHVNWRLLKNDKRVRVAVPIIAVPADSLGNVHTARFAADKTLGTDNMYYPRATREFYEGKSAPGTYRGKKILALHGGIDSVVPPAFGQKDWDTVIVPECGPGNAVQWIQPGRGHICTPEMVEKAAEWFYRWGVADISDAPRAKL
jgi:hypothetical protein